jgi:hypothetical protein
MSEVTGAEYGILIYSKHFLGRGRWSKVIIKSIV